MQNHLASNIHFLAQKRGVSLSDLQNTCALPEGFIQQADKLTLTALQKLSAYFDLTIDTLAHIDLQAKATKAGDIKLLVLDIDGVLSDGGMYYTEQGDELKKFNTKDGLAIKRLVKNGMQVAFLSNGKNSKLIQSRAQLLGVQKVYVGFDEKIGVLDAWLKELNITYTNVAYVGDDLNDLQVIDKVGFSACPANAVDAIKKKVNIILSANGGDACVREFIDSYLDVRY